MDSLITTIVIVVIAAIATWFKKLGQPKDTDEETRMRRSITTPRPTQPGQPRPFAQPRPQSGPVSWEEELRRLLEGGTPAAPPPMRPPPVVITQAPRSTPTGGGRMGGGAAGVPPSNKRRNSSSQLTGPDCGRGCAKGRGWPG